MSISSTTAQNLVKGDYGYLFCHMSDRGEYTAYAVSRDGYNYQDIKGGDPIFDPKVHARIEGGTRDAFITRTYDGKGYVMVTTDMCVAKSKVWDNYGIDLLKSNDLFNWTSVTFDFRKGMSNFCDGKRPCRLIETGLPSIVCGLHRYFGILITAGTTARKAVI